MISNVRSIAIRIQKVVQKKKKKANPVRWGIIGTGYMAETFATAIDGNSEGIVAAVASREIRRADIFAQKHGNCKAYGSYKDIAAAKDIDIIYIATPTKQHFENVYICLLEGKNVLCEKPITSNTEEFIKLQYLAKEKDCFLMEGMWMKCLPTYQKALNWIAEGKIGNIELIRADFYKREYVDTTRTVFNKDADGGVLKDYGVYVIAFALGFLGERPDALEAYSCNSFLGIDSDWMIHLKLRDIQVFANISSNFRSTSKAVVIGSNGSIEWEHQFNRSNKIILYDIWGIQKEVFQTKYQFDGFEYEINEVQQCIRQGLKENEHVSLTSSYLVLSMIDTLKDKCNS